MVFNILLINSDNQNISKTYLYDLDIATYEFKYKQRIIFPIKISKIRDIIII